MKAQQDMDKILPRTTYLAATCALLLVGCSAPDDVPPSAETNNDSSIEMITGGYSESSADDPFVQDAESLALDALYKAHPTRMNAEVTKREVQVVAGLNHRFHIGLGGGDNRYKKMYVVVVYQMLDGTLEVTNMDEISSTQ